MFYKPSRYALFVILFFTVLRSGAQERGGGNDSGFRNRPIDTTLTPNAQALAKIERMYFVLNRITNSVEQGMDTKEIEDKLPEIASNLSIIKESLAAPGSANLKNLQLFQVSVQDMLEYLRNWRKDVAEYNKQLASMNTNVNNITNDSTLKSDSSKSQISIVYARQLKEVKQRLVVADSITSANQSKIEKLQNQISDNFLTAIELRGKLRQQLKKYSTQSFSKEAPFLWEGKQDSSSTTISKRVLGSEQKIMNYYFRNSSANRYWMLLLGVVFFLWVFLNFQKIRRKDPASVNNEFRIHFLSRVSILCSIVVMLTVAPFFDFNPPAIYVTILQFWLLITLTFLLGKNWPRKLFYYWLIIVFLYFLFAFTKFIFKTELPQRWWMLILNIAGIVLSLLFLPKIGKNWSLRWLIVPVIFIVIALNTGAIFTNVFGRVTLTETLSLAAITGLTQIIALAVFMQIIVEAFYLQILRMRIGGGLGVTFEFTKIQVKLKQVLSVLCLLLWLIVFTTNLNIYDSVYSAIMHFLTDKRKLGSTNFTFGSILLFFIIIYVANLLQKYISYFYGSTGDSLVPAKRGMGSRLLFTRLILLTLGFLLAVAASGLPLDKITIILGALGVGIGLGLQNIVNNLVSGIVLIFERPLEIGDSIEVGDKKGVVKEIGLRSTRLISDDGAEIIIPNGDFLSQHVVNRTLSDNLIRLAIPVYVMSDADLVVINKIISDVIAASENVYKGRPASIIIDNIAAKRIRLKIYFWITDVENEDEIRSEVQAAIRTEFIKKEIALG